MSLEAPSRLGCMRAPGQSVRADFGALSNVIRINYSFYYYSKEGESHSQQYAYAVHQALCNGVCYLGKNSRIFACVLRSRVSLKSLAWSRRPVAVP